MSNAEFQDKWMQNIPTVSPEFFYQQSKNVRRGAVERWVTGSHVEGGTLCDPVQMFFPSLFLAFPFERQTIKGASGKLQLPIASGRFVIEVCPTQASWVLRTFFFHSCLGFFFRC